MKNNLAIPGIFNLIISFFWLIFGIPDNMPALVMGMFLIVVGVLCIMYSKLTPEKLYEKRNVLLVFGIILIPFNIVSAILLLVESDKVKVQYSKYLKEQDTQVLDSNNNNVKVSKEIKKVDALLKLGIVMVAVSGIMIATTSWEIISDFVKMIIIALIGMVFLGLSFFSDKKLKIRGTTITYWLLSMISFSLSIFMIGNYEILGNWFSLVGDGSSIFMATLILCISLFSYITYKRFDLESFLYIACFGIAFSIALVVEFISQQIEVSLFMITIIITLVNFIPKSENKEIKIVKLFGVIASFIITALLIVEEAGMENVALILITLILQIVNLVNISLSNKREEITILSGLSIIALTVVAMNNIEWNLDYIYVSLLNRSIILILSIVMCLLLVRNKNNSIVLLSIVIPLVLVSLIFEINVLVAIYIGCVSLLMIILGFVKKDLKPIYIEGIVFLVANLVIQLWEFWGLLPIWVYLLIGGLTLIGIVTCKELKK